MKILIVNKFLFPNGGSETYIFKLGECLTAMGHEVQYFGMDHVDRIVGNAAGMYTTDMDFHAAGGLRKLSYPFKIVHSKEAARKITRVLDDFKPDVVHFNNINFQLTPSVIESVADYDISHRTDIRIIYTAHDAQWVCPNHLLRVPSDGRLCFDCEGGRYLNCVRNRCIHGSRVRSLIGAFEAYYYKNRKTYGLVDTVICPSEFMKRTLETNPELEGKCVVLRNFMPDGVSSAIKGHTDDRYVLYFGRYSEEKGISTLLKACERLSDISFIFAGAGPMSDEIHKLTNVTDVGFKSGDVLYSLIRGAEFCVFPSEWHENCPFTVIEAISCKTPIIASSTGGTPELVRDNENGLLFEVGDVDTLAGHMRRLWDDPGETERLRKGCMDTRFMTADEYCERLVEIYAEESAV